MGGDVRPALEFLGRDGEAFAGLGVWPRHHAVDRVPGAGVVPLGKRSEESGDADDEIRSLLGEVVGVAGGLEQRAVESLGRRRALGLREPAVAIAEQRPAQGRPAQGEQWVDEDFVPEDVAAVRFAVQSAGGYSGVEVLVTQARLARGPTGRGSAGDDRRTELRGLAFRGLGVDVAEGEPIVVEKMVGVSTSRDRATASRATTGRPRSRTR